MRWTILSLGWTWRGDEAITRPQDIASCFLPAFKICLPLTIHAGEGEPADSIWEAAYQLHADRIGHGLTISEHADLAARFRDRGMNTKFGLLTPELAHSASAQTAAAQQRALPKNLHLLAPSRSSAPPLCHFQSLDGTRRIPPVHFPRVFRPCLVHGNF